MKILGLSCGSKSRFMEKGKNKNFHYFFPPHRSIEEYVGEKLEQIRCSMAQAIVEDLLANAFKALESEAAAKTESTVSHVTENETRSETIVASAAIPIPIKSFSFV